MGSSFSSSGKPKASTSSGGGGLFGTSSGQDFLDAFNAQNGPASTVAAPAPAPAYNPYASPIYTQASGSADKRYGDFLANAHKQEDFTAADYGATLSRDSNDYVTGSSIDWNTIDASNPFSRAALLKRSYTQGQAGSKNSYAERGMLHSGALQNALDAGNFNYEQGQDSISKALAQMILNSNASKTTAGNDREDAKGQAWLAALQNAPSPT